MAVQAEGTQSQRQSTVALIINIIIQSWVRTTCSLTEHDSTQHLTGLNRIPPILSVLGLKCCFCTPWRKIATAKPARLLNHHKREVCRPFKSPGHNPLPSWLPRGPATWLKLKARPHLHNRLELLDYRTVQVVEGGSEGEAGQKQPWSRHTTNSPQSNLGKHQSCAWGFVVTLTTASPLPCSLALSQEPPGFHGFL